MYALYHERGVCHELETEKCVIAGFVTTGPGGGLFATAMTSYRLFTYMF